jgi:hypothetical protein
MNEVVRQSPGDARDFIEFQCFHMCQRLRVGNSRDRLDDGVRASADDDVGSAKLSPRPIRKRHFQSPRTNEASDAEDQLRAAALEILQVHLVQARTILRLGANTAGMSIAEPGLAIPPVPFRESTSRPSRYR